jgi:hypothetical protein
MSVPSSYLMITYFLITLDRENFALDAFQSLLQVENFTIQEYLIYTFVNHTAPSLSSCFNAYRTEAV